MKKNEFNCSKACICVEDKCPPDDSIDCECNKKEEELIKCHNYLLCENKETKELLDSHDGLCIYCHILNGKLTINENKTEQMCSFCLYVSKYAVEFPTKCDHHICIECYKKKYLFEVDNNEKFKNNIFSVCSICCKF